MTRVLHLVVGPAEHGVVRHATGVARACGDDLLQFDDALRCRLPAGYDVVHVPFTDRLFGDSAEASAAAFDALAGQVLASGAQLSTTLHDVPSGESALSQRRRRAYSTVARHISGLVVASNAELRHAQRLGDQARSRCVIPLPVYGAAHGRCSPTGSTVAVLGFVYPDRGYEEVIAALPAGLEIAALGRAADGHDDLPETLRQAALRAGRTWHLTGFLTDEALSRELQTVAVPVAPNRRTAASASIATWLAHGRRPLVPVSAYAHELDRCWPNTIRMYDAGSPGALEAAIRQAHANPESTLLEAGVKPGPTETEIAAAYRTHFAACAPRVVGAAGRFAVPENRWDLLPSRSPQSPAVSVVIPYYNAPRQLQLVLTGLRLQRYPTARMEIIVADDGSSQPPSTEAAGELRIRVVRQEDRGFRAAAARNLGAGVADGDVLLFLDGDTVPEPDYVCRMTRLPGLSPDALVVGRRRHADFTDWTPADLTGWLAGGATPPQELTEPRWLREGYRRSRNLLDVDDRSYRYVISAVLGLHRELFAEIGGFCEQFSSYGGEDWELAHRAYCAGALLAHERAAVAWHDGPEWAERDIGPGVDRERSKAAETLMLRRLLPDRAERGPGQWLPYPAVVVRLDAAAGTRRIRDAAATAFAAGTDCAFWLAGPRASQVADELDDSRIRCGPTPPDVLARALTVVDLSEPAELTDLPRLLGAMAHGAQIRTPHGRLRSTRAIARGRRHAAAFGADVDAAEQVLFGRRDVSAQTC